VFGVVVGFFGDGPVEGRQQNCSNSGHDLFGSVGSKQLYSLLFYRRFGRLFLIEFYKVRLVLLFFQGLFFGIVIGILFRLIFLRIFSRFFRIHFLGQLFLELGKGS